MKIDSSMIGMESARRYSSVTRRSAAYSLAGSGVYQGRNLQGDAFSQLLNTGADEEAGQKTTKGMTKEAFPGAGGEMADLLAESNQVYESRITYRSVTSVSEKKTMQSIRQMCVQYLIRWLYNVRPIENYDATSGMTSIRSIQAGTSYYHGEQEQTQFNTVGTVRTSDGREISFNLGLTMSRSYMEYAKVNLAAQPQKMTDPLIINLDTDMTALSDQKFEFDIDSDGIKESISQLGKGSGYLALDQNGDGIINNGSELFGTESGDGFRDLAEYDSDGNGWIDENDPIFDKLLIWAKDDSGQDELYTLKKSGVGAICLQKARTDFSLNSLKNNQANGKIRSTGIFLYENGNVGTMQQLDLAQ